MASSFPNIFDTLKHIFFEVVCVACVVVFRPSGRFSNICQTSQSFMVRSEGQQQISPHSLVELLSADILTLGNKSTRISSKRNSSSCSATVGKDEKNKRNDHQALERG